MVHADRAAVHIVGGYGSGLGFVAETLRSLGVDRVAVEDPALSLYTRVLRSVGLRTVPAPVDVDQCFAIGFSGPPEHHFPTALERMGELFSGLG